MPLREEHIGTVRDNNDPDKRGRLMIECPTIVSGETMAGWIEPSFHFVDSSQNSGCMWIPNIGSTVTVSIEAEEEAEVNGLDPRWKCEVFPQGTVPEEFKTNYPNRKGWVTKGGHILIFDDTENELEFYYKHSTGAEIRVTDDGDIILTPASGRSVKVGGSDADEPLVLGTQLEEYFNTLVTGLVAVFNTHKHTGVTTGTGSSAVPDKVLSSFPSSALSSDNKVK